MNYNQDQDASDLGINFAEAGLGLIPSGQYKVVVAEIKKVSFKGGTRKGIGVKLRVFSPEDRKGAEIEELFLTVQDSDNAKRRAYARLKQFNKSCGMPTGELTLLTPYLQKCFEAEIGIEEYKGESKNVIVTFGDHLAAESSSGSDYLAGIQAGMGEPAPVGASDEDIPF